MHQPARWIGSTPLPSLHRRFRSGDGPPTRRAWWTLGLLARAQAERLSAWRHVDSGRAEVRGPSHLARAVMVGGLGRDAARSEAVQLGNAQMNLNALSAPTSITIALHMQQTRIHPQD
jgi:hypothetical protein